MKRKYWGAIIILIVLIIVGVLIYNSNKQIVRECPNQSSKQSGYCVYDNIPTYLKYSEPSFFIEAEDGTTIIRKGGQTTDEVVVEFKDNLSEYLIRDDSSKRLSEVFSGDWSSYKCVSTDEVPITIEYFYNLCEGFEGMEGCWHERRAVICGDIYFVQDSTSTYGPRLYGPFTIDN